jgi:hypothetical protein
MCLGAAVLAPECIIFSPIVSIGVLSNRERFHLGYHPIKLLASAMCIKRSKRCSVLVRRISFYCR